MAAIRFANYLMESVETQTRSQLTLWFFHTGLPFSHQVDQLFNHCGLACHLMKVDITPC